MDLSWWSNLPTERNESRNVRCSAIIVTFVNCWRGWIRERTHVCAALWARVYNSKKNDSTIAPGLSRIIFCMEGKYEFIRPSIMAQQALWYIHRSRTYTHATTQVTSYALARGSFIAVTEQSHIRMPQKTASSYLERFRKLSALHVTYLKWELAANIIARGCDLTKFVYYVCCINHISLTSYNCVLKFSVYALLEFMSVFLD